MIETVIHLKVTVEDGVVAAPADVAQIVKNALELRYWEVKAEPVNAADPRK